jgi:dephospho-CoA kinase
MKIIAITGPFGSGKTTVTQYISALLKKAGEDVHVISLDEIARHTIDESPVIIKKLADHFGDDIVNDDGSLNRPLLAQRAFADPQSTAELNAITHPATMTRAREILAATLDLGITPILESPFPISYISEVADPENMNLTIWTVGAPPGLRLQRGIHDGYKEEDALRRMKAQAGESAYVAEAATVIENSGTLGDLREAVRLWLRKSDLLKTK